MLGAELDMARIVMVRDLEGTAAERKLDRPQVDAGRGGVALEIPVKVIARLKPQRIKHDGDNVESVGKAADSVPRVGDVAVHG